MEMTDPKVWPDPLMIPNVSTFPLLRCQENFCREALLEADCAASAVVALLQHEACLHAQEWLRTQRKMQRKMLRESSAR